MKDEGPYLREWIEYHRMVGVEKFILYNNESSDRSDDILRPYVEQGIVTLFHTDMEACQVPCYYNALRLARGRSRWVAFIDLDEFLVPINTNDFRDVLRIYEDAAALAVNWLVFGTGGHPVQPHGLQIENFITRAEIMEPEHNRHIKSIVDPQKALTPLSPHHFLYAKGIAVDEEGTAVAGPYGTHKVNHCRVHHYVTRSRAEWFDKIERGYSSIPKDHPTYRRSEEFFQSLNRNEEVDLTMHRFCPELNRRCGNDHIRLVRGFEPANSGAHQLRLAAQQRHWWQAGRFEDKLVEYSGIPKTAELQLGVSQDPSGSVIDSMQTGDVEVTASAEGLVLARHNGLLVGWESWNPKTEILDQPLSQWREVALVDHLARLGIQQIERQYQEDGGKRISFPEVGIDFYLDRHHEPVSMGQSWVPDPLKNSA